ncbi:MAG: hypothetical protein U0790_25195 [Isosphaeraceae bacterium]
MSHVFQSQFPAQEALAIAVAARQGTFGPPLIRSAWVVAEYAVNRLAPADLVGEPLQMTSVLPEGTDESGDAFDRLHVLASEHLGMRTLAPSLPVPWTTVVAVLLRLIAGAIEGKQAGTE